MKTFKRIVRTFLILLIPFYVINCKKDKAIPVVITLTADTSQIGEELIDPPGITLSAKPASVVIFDDGDPKMFTIKVKVGTDIVWEGVTAEGGDVDIEKIIYKSGTNIFDKDSIPGKIDKGKEKVKLKVKKKTTPGNDYVYKIKYKVSNRTYTLDPKIQVN